MEVKLSHLQSQLEVANASLEEEKLLQKDLLQRTEKVEKRLLELEDKLSHLSKTRKNLRENLQTEKLQIEEIKKKLHDTEYSLHTNNILLDTAEHTETKLTDEAKNLLTLMTNSLNDSDSYLHQLMESRECDIQRRKSARDFHACMSTGLEKITLCIKQLFLLEESNQLSITSHSMETYKHNDKFRKKSIDTTREILLFVADLKDTLKFQLMDKNNHVPATVSFTVDTLDRIQNVKCIFEEGEENLSRCFHAAHAEIDEYSQLIQRIQLNHTIKSDKLLSRLTSGITKSQNRIRLIITSTSQAIRDIHQYREESLADLNVVHSQWIDSFLSSAAVIEEYANKQKSKIEKSLEICSNEQDRSKAAANFLENQCSQMDQKGMIHLGDITSQMNMINIQGKNAVAAQKRQRELQEKFLHNVMNGVHQLIRSQMTKIRQEQEEHYTLFAEQNQCLVETNHRLRSTARSIIDKVDETNTYFSEKVEAQREQEIHKQEAVKQVIQESISILTNLEEVATNQKILTKSCASKANLKLKKLMDQSISLNNIMENVEKKKEEYLMHLQNSMCDNTHNCILEMTQVGKELSQLTSEKILKTTQISLKEMMKQRMDVSSDVLTMINKIYITVRDGNTEIEAIINRQCGTVDELLKKIMAKSNDFKENSGKQHLVKIDEHKMTITKLVENNKKETSAALSSSLLQASSLQQHMGEFKNKVINMDEKDLTILKSEYPVKGKYLL